VRRTVAAVTVLVALAAAAPSAGADNPAPYRRHDYGAVLNILPPGTDGSLTAAEVLRAQTTGEVPANFADQLAMYDGLATESPASLTDAEIATRYFKDASFGVRPEDIVSTETPKPGVRIVRDRFGVPHVYGDTFEDVVWGAGWAGTQDRMFLQDVLRHVGAARVTEFLGPSEANIAMDRAQLAVADYTPEEAQAQLDALVRRHGPSGAKFVRGLGAFAAGINAAQRDAVVKGTLPAEYVALQVVPEDWQPTDVVYVASLVGGIFGKGGGGEYANAIWLQRLQRKFGRAAGRRVFDDLRAREDAEAPTTIRTRFTYPRPSTVTAAAVALPDVDGPIVPGTGGAASGVTGPVSLPTRVDGPAGPIRLDWSGAMSNALVVDAAHSTTGHPIAVFGPQTGYFTPQLLTEIDLHGPGFDVRGASFAGTQAVVQLGRGRDYAWSATSMSGDNVDQVVDVLCTMDGSAPTTSSTAYMWGDECVPMYQRTHTQVAKPSAGGTGPPQVVRMQVLRTRHGIVNFRTTAAGRPVAIVTQRSTYGHELDSGVGFMRINDPAYVRDAATFARAFSAVDYTFNWFYVDDRDIAYFGSGLLPHRAAGVDPALPRWGTGAYDWRGWLSFAQHPQAVNPPQGYFANWNNKPAPGFNAADDVWGYGPVYRSQNLSRRIAAATSGGRRVDRRQMVGMMLSAATVDTRGVELAPWALRVVGDDPAARAELRLLRSWIAGGAHRLDRDRNGRYSHEAAIALFDEWYPRLAKATLRGRLGALTDQLPQGLDDHPRHGIGSAWNGVAWYGYVSKDLRSLLGQPVRSPYSRRYCGAGSLAACRRALRASLAEAVAVLRSRYGADPTGWRYDKHQDDIRPVTVGIVGVPPIDWQNRPTFQQVATFPRHRPRA